MTVENEIAQLRQDMMAMEIRIRTDLDNAEHPGVSALSWPQQSPDSSGWSAPSIVFGTTHNGGLEVAVQQGKVYFKGVSITISSWPIDGEVTVTNDSTLYGYIEISLSSATATWKTSTSDPGDGDDDTEIWRIFKATAAGGKLTEIIECQHGDIHVPGNA
jgi:hypothetical protein